MAVAVAVAAAWRGAWKLHSFPSHMGQGLGADSEPPPPPLEEMPAWFGSQLTGQTGRRLSLRSLEALGAGSGLTQVRTCFRAGVRAPHTPSFPLLCIPTACSPKLLPCCRRAPPPPKEESILTWPVTA